MQQIGGTITPSLTKGGKRSTYPITVRRLLIATILIIAAILLCTQISYLVSFDDASLLDLLATSPPGPCITFLGDIMLSNLARDVTTSRLAHPRDAFKYIRPLLSHGACGSDDDARHIVANLEGPITKLGLAHVDPIQAQQLTPENSYNMDPDVVPNLLVDEGINHLGRANNHLNDRGPEGIVDTSRALQMAGISHFGFGRTNEEALAPLILNLHATRGRRGTPIKVGITAFSELYDNGVEPGGRERNQTGLLPVTSESARLACSLLDEKEIGLRIAYIHWGLSYRPVSMQMREQAAILVEEGGFDMIIGNGGSHLVGTFEFIGSVPVLYNIGNFVVQTRGKYKKKKDILPYGLAVHVSVTELQRFGSLELHCIHVDNSVANYQPRICTADQAEVLFSSMVGPFVEYQQNETKAIVIL